MAALPPFGRKMEYPVWEIYINSKHAKKKQVECIDKWHIRKNKLDPNDQVYIW
jgi:hypothetical protein